MLRSQSGVLTSSGGERISLTRYLEFTAAWPKSTLLGAPFKVMLGKSTTNTIYTQPADPETADICCVKVKTGCGQIEFEPVIVLPVYPQTIQFTLAIEELDFTYSWHVHPQTGRRKHLMTNLPYPLDGSLSSCSAALECRARLTTRPQSIN